MNAQVQPAATPTGMPNPLGIHGFEFVEFAAPDAAGQYLIPGMTIASVMLLAVAVVCSFRNDGSPPQPVIA